MIRRSIVRAVFLFAIACAGMAAAQIPESDDVRFLSELRRLRLYAAAERFAARRVPLISDDPAAQVDLFSEHLRTLAAQASESPLEARAAQWQKAASAATEFHRAFPNHARKAWIDVQAALVEFARLDQLRREAEARGDEPALTAVRTDLRAVEKSLVEAEEVNARELLDRKSRNRRDAETLDREAFRDRLTWQLARVRRTAALCYAEGSRDRKAFLLAALEGAEKGATPSGVDAIVAGQLRAVQAACLRELGRPEEALLICRLLDRPETEESVRRAALIELLRTHLAQGDLRAAQASLEEARFAPLFAANDPEAALARFEVILAALRKAAKTDEAAKRRTAEAADEIERRFGPYWGRRVAILLGSQAIAGNASADLDLLARAAESHVQRNRLDDAIAAYDQASRAAHMAGDETRALAFAYQAAACEQKRRAYSVAAQRFIAAAAQFAAQAEAPKAHLAGCWCLARQLKTDDAVGSDYIAALLKHEERWPADPTADQVRLWLAARYAAEARPRESFAALSRISQESSHAVAARKQMFALSCIAPDAIAEDAELSAAAIVRWETLAAKADSSEAAIASLSAVALRTQRPTPDWKKLAATLGELEQRPNLPAELRGCIATYRVLTLAAESEAAKPALERALTVAAPEELVQLARLMEMRTDRAKDDRKTVAKTELEFLRSLETRASEFVPETSAQFAARLGEIAAVAGEREEALKRLAERVRKNPDDGALQESYAVLLAAGNDPAELRTALGAWRTIAARSEPRSERWYRAKFAVAETELKLGHAAGALKLVLSLEATPPGLAGTPWSERFAALRKQCELAMKKNVSP